jgi:CCR4-NOT transcription complex subunit 1
LDLKETLLEAYQYNRLAFILPLICRILSGTKGSKVFKPPNPWIKLMYGLLVEIY